MIQRIHHLYLFLNFLLAIYFSLMPIIEIDYILNGHSFVETINASTHAMKIDDGALVVKDSYMFPMIMIGISGLLSFVSIFQFRNRKLQRGTCFLNYLFIILFILSIIRLWMGIENIDVMDITKLSWVNLVLMVLMLFLNFFAVAGINRDEALVRSADRLR